MMMFDGYGARDSIESLNLNFDVSHLAYFFDFVFYSISIIIIHQNLRL